MTIYSHVYIITRRHGCELEILANAHRRLEFARKELADMEDAARKAGSRCMHTQAGCCLRVQKGDDVTYYEIIKRELQ